MKAIPSTREDTVIGSTNKLPNGPLRLGWIVALGVSVGFVLVIAACGEDESIAQSAAGAATLDIAKSTVSDAAAMMATSDAQGVVPDTTPTPEAGHILAHGAPLEPGAASPSIEARIYESDVVVRATLSSVNSGEFTFKAIEYLKGNGPAEFSVAADTLGWDEPWDDREAVLFLSLLEGQEAARASRDSAATTTRKFAFTVARDYYLASPSEYTIDGKSPAWLPIEESSNSASATLATSTNPVFITDSGKAIHFPWGASYTEFRKAMERARTASSTQETISLADLRAKIAWIEAEDSEEYDFCVAKALNHIMNNRNWEAYYGVPRPRPQKESQLASGTSEGTLVEDFGPYLGEQGYHKFWLAGKDSGLFHRPIIDDDKDASNGYYSNIITARPLPAGKYRFSSHGQHFGLLPCKFVPNPETTGLDWAVTVTAPSGTVHEAFFDPASTFLGVGASGGAGVISPASFNVGGATTTITRIVVSFGSMVTMQVSPSVSLSGKHVEFIKVDGTVAARLSFDAGDLKGGIGIGGAAAGNGTSTAEAAVSAEAHAEIAAAMAEAQATGSKMYFWFVSSSPWKAGDKLMLRIR